MASDVPRSARAHQRVSRTIKDLPDDVLVRVFSFCDDVNEKLYVLPFVSKQFANALRGSAHLPAVWGDALDTTRLSFAPFKGCAC
jgi:hypothetical protein